MKFHPTTAQLKNESVVTIRSDEPKDAAKLLSAVKQYIANSEFIPKQPEEFKLTIAQEEEWISSFLQKDNSLFWLPNMRTKSSETLI